MCKYCGVNPVHPHGNKHYVELDGLCLSCQAIRRRISEKFDACVTDYGRASVSLAIAEFESGKEVPDTFLPDEIDYTYLYKVWDSKGSVGKS